VRGIRVLRYIGNRAQPEKELYDPLEYILRDFPLLVAVAHNDLVEVSKHIPNVMFSDYEKHPGAELFTPVAATSPWVPFVRAPVRPQEQEFEVNMMEALLGWKSWCWDSGILKSNCGNCLWHPDTPTVAECVAGCAKVPAEHHTCGIYAATNRRTANDYEEVLGLVYGWGRYIRHSGGWKAQFAYPRCFYLQEEQMNLVELLMQYHVPIYVSQSVQMYDPAEEGYDGYWSEEGAGTQIHGEGRQEWTDPDEET
jgi:hypothetical protein